VDRSQTAEAISGRATGVLFFAGFGTLWLCTGLAAMHRLNVGAYAVALVILAALVIPALGVLKRASNMPRKNADPEVEARISRTFNRANTAQWIAIPVAVVLLNVIHQKAYIVPAIATIVGLHLFPLARAFRYSTHYVTGALLVLWSAASVFMLPRENVASVGALGTSAILLLSAAYTLANAARAAASVSKNASEAPSVSV
jgi:hypothetical protein